MVINLSQAQLKREQNISLRRKKTKKYKNKTIRTNNEKLNF